MSTHAKAARGGHPSTASKHDSGANFPQNLRSAQPRRLPPYASRLRPRPDLSLLVIVGRRGWELFDRKSIDYGILLPDPSPSLYRWPDLSVWADGLLIDADGTLTSDEEREIARALLVSGCPYVIGRFSSYKGGRTV